jgi:putative hydrolase of HD superfamily
MERLLQQMEFLIEADKLKNIVRRNYISDGSKRENDAEHSWYFALAAMILAEYANNEVDIQKVIKMSIIHDLVEIYAGDTFIYDEKGKESQQERDQIASEKIFGLLPEDQKKYYRELWNEFEGNSTNESKFARAIDRIVPILLNMKSSGLGWKENKVGYTQVFEVSSRIAHGSSTLWHYIKEMLEENKDTGLFYNSEMN